VTREPETIGDYLRIYVDANFPSKRAAAEAFGCKPESLSAIMSGAAKPTPAMCEALGVVRHEVWCPKAMSVPGLRMKYTPARQLPPLSGPVDPVAGYQPHTVWVKG
jgi:hypothetical protein